MISNGFFLQPKLIEELNAAGLQEMQISIDGVRRNETTEKVLDNLKKRLLALREHARFRVTVSGVIGAAPPNEAEEVIAFARELGFTPRVLLVHDQNGQLKLKPDEVKAFQRIVNTLPKSWIDFSSYRKRLVRDGRAPFKCRAGSRYLYIDEFGNVNWCSQTRTVWSKPLTNYTREDLREQFHIQILQRDLHAWAARVPRANSITGEHRQRRNATNCPSEPAPFPVTHCIQTNRAQTPVRRTPHFAAVSTSCHQASPISIARTFPSRAISRTPSARLQSPSFCARRR